jgi:hypothetical protein
MMHIQGETNGRRQPMPRSETGLFKDRLIEAKASLVTAVLASKSCYVQSTNAPLRYRLLTDTALRLAELNQAAAYFDLTALAYQHNLTTWVQNSVRLLAIQLNLPMPNGRWWQAEQHSDPIDYFMYFLGEQALKGGTRPILLSFDEADELLKAPLAADFFRLLRAIKLAQLSQPDFQRLTILLWGKIAWHDLAKNGRFPSDTLKLIVL